MNRGYAVNKRMIDDRCAAWSNDMRWMWRSHRGFTLLELLLVLVILGVLAAMIVPKFAGRSQQAREVAAKADISTLRNVIGQFEIDTGRLPTADEGLRALLTEPSNVQGWHGPYLDRGLPKDPWGNEYVYRNPGEVNQGGFDIVSAGADGRAGTEDDIVN